MVPEIWSATGNVPFYPPMDLENQNFEKNEKTAEDIIILQMCTIDDNIMMYSS